MAECLIFQQSIMAETVLARANDAGWTSLSKSYLPGFDLSASALSAFTVGIRGHMGAC
jgi:hypothetical protein